MQAGLTGRITVRDQGVAETIGNRASAWMPIRQRMPDGVGAKDSRLLSLEQRAAMKGSHPRRSEPMEGKLYVAGVALPGSSEDGRHAAAGVIPLFSRPVTITLGEIDPGDPEGLLRVVEHYRWGRQPEALIQRLRDLLWGAWHCRAVLVGGIAVTGRMLSLRPRASGIGDLAGEAAPSGELCAGLLEAADAGRVNLYADDGSTESREFWSQAIRGRRRWGEGRMPEFYIEPSTGDDGFLISLALAIRAGVALRAAPARASLSAA